MTHPSAHEREYDRECQESDARAALEEAAHDRAQEMIDNPTFLSDGPLCNLPDGIREFVAHLVAATMQRDPHGVAQWLVMRDATGWRTRFRDALVTEMESTARDEIERKREDDRKSLPED